MVLETLKSPMGGETQGIDTLPAGGNDPTRFDCKEVWYPVHYVKDLDRTKLIRFTLLGEDLVLWWDVNASQWRAFRDRCPHRLVPLSEGRVNEEGLLECPYHGWTFRGAGECDRIPQQLPGMTAQDSKRACVQSYPTTERQGLLFVFPGNPENALKTTVPIIEPLEDGSEEWVCMDTFRDLPYDALTLLENVIDASHIPYTHHRTVGNRSNASPVELEVVEAGKNGFQGVWEEGPRKGTLGRQDTTFIAPGLMWHDLTSKQFGRTLTVVYATPIRKGECRLFARFPFKFNSKIPATFIKLTPRWYSHINQNAILEDDQIFLHFQERYLEQSGGGNNITKAFYLPTKADRFVMQLRQWEKDFAADPFPGESLPPRLSTQELLDRYHSHTVHCASCRTALKNIQRIRFGLGIAGAISWTLLPILALLWGQILFPVVVGFSVTILAGLGAWLYLGKLERKMIEGRHIPPRNLPEKQKK